MMNRILCAGLTYAIVLFAPLVVGAADVSDGAGFFSAEALTKANQAIQAIEKKSGHHVRIETFATVPDGKAEAVSKMSKSERETFFTNWEHDRVESTSSRGLYILICKSPAHVRMWAGNPLQLAGFHEAQARAIREPLIKDLRAKEYDKALADAVSEVTTVFNGLKPAHHAGVIANPQSTPHRTAGPIQHQAPAPAPQQAGFGGLFWVMAIIIGGVLLFSLISRMFSGGGGGYAPPAGYGQPGMGYGGAPGYGGGGGGFMKSLAGGIFGAVAGNWLYDQFSGGHAHGSDGGWSNHPDPSGSNSNLGDNSDSGFAGGADFGGGDFGDDSGGGGDFGGGGSDFGGGDEF